MLIRILKVFGISAVLIYLLSYANQVLSDADTLKPESVCYFTNLDSIGQLRTLDIEKCRPQIPDSAGYGHVRARFDFSAGRLIPGKKELIISFLGSYDLYWNNMLIGRNGRIAKNPGAGKPGYIDRKFIIPDTLISSGMNELVLHYSDHQNTQRHSETDFSIEPYNEFYKRSLVSAMLIYSLAGIFLIIGIYYLLLFINTFRKVSFLIFAALCLTSCLLIVYAYSRNYYPYTYPMYATRREIIGALSWLITILLPLFYLFYFEVPRKRIWVLATIILLGAGRLLPTDFLWFYTSVAMLLPFGFVTWAFLKNKQGSSPALIGLIIFISSFAYFNVTLYVGFGVLIMVTLYALTQSLGMERKRYEESLLRSSRLEAQMLKKNIQPHFLMNTLTNIISLIETDPKLSIRLIESLSTEFYAMMDIANQKLVSMRQELELCKAHLEVMSIRNDVAYLLKTAGISQNGMIPPAVFHTLIENGITHNRPIDGRIIFELSETFKKNERQYQFLTRGVPKQLTNIIEDGTGLKYVKSRLEESYPGRWQLTNSETATGWITEIQVPR